MENLIEPEPPGVIAELPRREFLRVPNLNAALAPMRNVSFRANRWQAIGRLFTWLKLIGFFEAGILWDKLRRRDTKRRRATRLRLAFERIGGAFVKLGMHLALRVDLMPWEYSGELTRMTDRVGPIPIEAAIATIERSTKKPLAATFSDFDPEPIDSTSVACNYQAVLRSGEKVVVKVRRPGVGEQFMTDLKAFDWLLSIVEFLTILRPGFTRGMRAEFRKMLLEELDFIQEARKQDAFRRAAGESGVNFFSSPRVHLEHSGEEMVVEEFASGLWLWELLSALETRDETVLTRAGELNIDPSKVAKRLLWVNYWAWNENLFFHADPNPNNIIIGQDSTLYWINFSSTGALTRSMRQAMRQFLHYTWQRDPLNMARAALVLLEPLPPVDLIELTQELETYNWQLLYALEATPESMTSPERTSFISWNGMTQMAHRYGIVIDIQVLRLMRASLLVESTAVRLNPRIDFIRQYRKFSHYRGEQARRRFTDTALQQLEGKTNEQLIIRLDRFAQMAEGLYFRARRFLSLPTANFNVLVSKWSYMVTILIRFIAQVFGLTAIAVLITALGSYSSGIQPVFSPDLLMSVFQNPIYQIVLIILIFVNGRMALFRMDDKEVA